MSRYLIYHAGTGEVFQSGYAQYDLAKQAAQKLSLREGVPVRVLGYGPGFLSRYGKRLPPRFRSFYYAVLAVGLPYRHDGGTLLIPESAESRALVQAFFGTRRFGSERIVDTEGRAWMSLSYAYEPFYAS